MATMAVEFKITDTEKAQQMLSVLADMMGDEKVSAKYKERIAKILSE
jgi:hypothetical protein